MKRKLIMNLQLFAEPSGEPTPVVVSPTEPTEPTTPTPTSAPAPTEPNIDDMVKRAVSEARKEWEAKLDQAEKYKKMTKDEREKAELLDKIAEQEKLLAESRFNNLKYEVSKTLVEKNIPLEFLEFIVVNNAEDTQNRINEFAKIYNKSVNGEVKKKFGEDNTTPKIDSNLNPITKEDFHKMSYNERVKLYEENKDLYLKLSNM